MADDISSLWTPEGQWAEREWRTRFETERTLLLAKNSAVNSTSTYGSISKAAAALFEEIGDQLVKRVHAIIGRCEELEQLGPEGAIPDWTLEPVARAARAFLPEAKQIAAQRGFKNVLMLQQSIEPHREVINQTAKRLRDQIQREVKFRRQSIESAKKSSAQKTTNERWQRWHHKANVFNILINFGVLALGYILGKIDALSRLYGWVKAFFQSNPPSV